MLISYTNPQYSDHIHSCSLYYFGKKSNTISYKNNDDTYLTTRVLLHTKLMSGGPSEGTVQLCACAPPVDIGSPLPDGDDLPPTAWLTSDHTKVASNKALMNSKTHQPRQEKQ